MKPENSHDMAHTLRLLLSIPHKILSFSDHDNVSEFVLNELCHDTCLNLDRAAYFVDNPDFNYFKGISGIDREKEKKFTQDIWKNPDYFNTYMRNSAFNKRVRDINKNSSKNYNEKDFINELAYDLSFNKHQYHTWDIKHGNRGFLLYEPSENYREELNELMPYATSLLAFCPIF